MLLNPRYGRVGLVAMPYYLVFELLGPVLEVIAWCSSFGLSIVLGIAPPSLILTFIALSCFFGLSLSTASLLIEEHAFRRYRRWSCLLHLMSVSLRRELRLPAVADADPPARLHDRAEEQARVGRDDAHRLLGRCRRPAAAAPAPPASSSEPVES